MNKRKRTLTQRLVSAPYIVWAAIFIVVPLLMVFYYAFTDAETGSFTFSNITAISGFADTFVISIWLGAVATEICLLISYPLAYFITKLSSRTQKFMLILIMLPMWINLLLRTYALMKILEDTGLINHLFNLLGLPSVHMINTRGAVIAGMVYNFIPYMVLPIYTVMSRIDRPLIEASNDLGAGSFATFRRVIMPMSLPGVISGITMVFVPSVSTFYISRKLGGTLTLIGDSIEYKFINENDYNVGAAMSLVLMVMIILCMLVMNRFSDGDEEAIVV